MDEKKYIKKIVLLNANNIEDKKELLFEKGINVIIGPKGGGKSSLLNIIHSFHNSISLSKQLSSMTKEFGFKISSIEYSNGESIYFKNLDNKQKEFNDLIKQDDQIKTKLDENKEIILAKQAFIKKLTNKKIEIISLIFSQYFSTFKKINEIKTSSQINWSSFLKSLDKSNNKIYNFILNLKRNLNFNFDENLSKDLEMFVLLERYLILLEENHKDYFLKYRNIFTNLLSLHKSNRNKLNQNNSTQKAFDEMINYFSKQANESSDITQSATLWKENISNLFIDLSKELAKNSCYFKKLQSGGIYFTIKGKEETQFGMILDIDKTIQLEQGDDDNDDSWHKEIFDRFLYTPNEKRSLWLNWVKKSNLNLNPLKISYSIFSLENNEKNLLEIKKIVEEILYKKVENCVQLKADGKDYLTMSLGTKTSYGLKQKIKNFNSPILFLDQPEDNLDNFTIYSELLSLFNKEKNNIEQIFLVTHNSNLGSLTHPSTITTCTVERNNLFKSYIQNNNINEVVQITNEIKDSPILHYLEGGEESLINREKVLLNKNKNHYNFKNKYKSSFSKNKYYKKNNYNNKNNIDKSKFIDLLNTKFEHNKNFENKEKDIKKIIDNKESK